MSEVLFYHLERRTLDDVLPGLVEKTLERGWRALIRAESSDRASAIDALLWTYDDQSFLPHAQLGDGEPMEQPLLITVEDGNPNGAQLLFLVGGAMSPDWGGADTKALTSARAAWKDAKGAGHDATYWKETPTGKWEKQA